MVLSEILIDDEFELGVFAVFHRNGRLACLG